MNRKETTKEYKYRISFSHPDIMEDLSVDSEFGNGERISVASIFVDIKDLTFRYNFKEYKMDSVSINKIVEIETIVNKILLYK